jgi:hypothetical protein
MNEGYVKYKEIRRFVSPTNRCYSDANHKEQREFIDRPWLHCAFSHPPVLCAASLYV